MVAAAGSERLPDAVPIVCGPGDVAITNRQAVHGSFANTSGDWRITLNFGFHRRRSVLGVQGGGVHNAAAVYDAARIRGTGADDRLWHRRTTAAYPAETPYVYAPHAGDGETYRWDARRQRRRAGLQPARPEYLVRPMERRRGLRRITGRATLPGKHQEGPTCPTHPSTRRRRSGSRASRRLAGSPTSTARPRARTHEKELPVGRHPLQLYSLGTPNGVKVTVMLEELLALGHKGAEYDAWLIKIGDGDQFGSGFVAINPNSKIPALVDRSGPKPIRVFETGAILVHLAEKFGAFLPTEPGARAETLSWLFWQMGSTPYVGGGFGHFYAYAPVKIEYAIDRFAMETKRLLDVLDKRLAENEYVAGSEYTHCRYGVLALVWRAGEVRFVRRVRVHQRARI